MKQSSMARQLCWMKTASRISTDYIRRTARRRIAIVSDIHDNLMAFEAVLADLRKSSPDSVPHGGDLAIGGSNPTRVADRVRDLGWQGVFGNADEAIARTETLEKFAMQSAAPGSLRGR
jgi:predicted phosphodiesterase